MQPPKSSESRPRPDFLQTIERLGVTLQNLLGLGVADPALVRPVADFVERAQVGGDVGVAVIGADHQVVFSSKLQERLDIVNRVDGDEQPIGAEQFRFQLKKARKSSLLTSQALAFYRSQLGDCIRNPRGSRLDESKPEFRKLRRKAGAHHRGKGVHDRETSVPFMAGKRVAGVDAQWQVERTGLLINWKKVRVGDIPVEVESSLEDAARAVLFRPPQLLDGLVWTKQRQHSRPT